MNATSLPANLLTDRLVHSWIRCHRKAWLDRYGDNQKRKWTAHRTLQLNQQHQNFSTLLCHKPGYGINACIKGEKGVIGLRLKREGPQNLSLETHPPLLLRTKGESIWGDYAYCPVISRQGKRITKEHRLSLAINGYLLESVQGTPVHEGLAIGRSNKKLEQKRIYFSEKLKTQLINTLFQISHDLGKSIPPPLTSDRRKCKLCSWRGVCGEEASSEGHLSEVSGIGARRRQTLQDLGIRRINDLAQANPENLSDCLKTIDNQNWEIHKLILQAKVQLIGKPHRINSSPSLPELNNANGVLIYDIESDPDEEEDFLHGFVILPRGFDGKWNLKNAIYHPILILKEQGETISIKRLKKIFNKYKNWPILHFGETEHLTISRILKLQKTKENEILELEKRFIDIHLRVRSSWHLPLNSYSLKSIASWLDFTWSQHNVDGAKALLWWRQWKSSKQKAKVRSNTLKRIYEYNREDCIATWSVTNWLIKQDKIFFSS